MTGRFTRRRASLLAGALGASVALALGGAPVLATTTGHQHFSGTDEFSYNDCGFQIDVEATFSGREVLRVDKTGQAFLLKGTVKYREVHTNPATGEWFVLRGNTGLNETKATQVDGTIYEFKSIETGQPFVVEDSEGNVVVRDRGSIHVTFLFDTLGDGQPGGNFIEDVDVSVRGPHPGFGDDFDFCALAAELTGA